MLSQAVSGLRWLSVFHDPRVADTWSLADWDHVVRVARRARLLARLQATLQAAGCADRVPPEVARHLRAAAVLSQSRLRALTWAIERLPEMLGVPDFPLVLLKGAAYVAQDLPIGRGRLPSDLDILVPPSRLAEVRFRLAAAGWREPELDEHDRRYYLEWSHELPPMTHPRHAVELDVHHAILAPRKGRTVPWDLLAAGLRPSGLPGWKVLDPVDQVLHSAAHLFHDAEPAGRIRDIVDLDGLLRHFGRDDRFWARLPGRAADLGLEEPFVMAVHFTRRWMSTDIPSGVLDAAARMRTRLPRVAAWTAVFERALVPADPDEGEGAVDAAGRWLLLARYHAHRLPPRLLVPHLWRKWRMRATAPPPPT